MGRPTESAAAPDPLQGWADGLLGFGHPVRLRALVLLEDEYSPKGLAEVMGDTPLGVVAYHVRMLRGYGLVEEVRTEPVRGAVEHFYHRTELADTLVAKLALPFGVPGRRPGRMGSEKRLAELKAWAWREPKPAPAKPKAKRKPKAKPMA
jgi:DNA-binding transcriptional ArsR family regulator